MFNQNNQDDSNKIDLNFLTNLNCIHLFAYPLSCLDFLTTTYGIASQGIDLDGIGAGVVSFILSIIFLWLILIVKDSVAPTIRANIGNPIRNLPVKNEQKAIAKYIANVIETVIIIGLTIAFIFIDFWTSLEGVSAFIPFKGILGFFIKIFAVFALVFATIYLVFLQDQKPSFKQDI